MIVGVTFVISVETSMANKNYLPDLSVLALLFLIWNSVTFSLLMHGKIFTNLRRRPTEKN
jgi:hypothetical protein